MVKGCVLYCMEVDGGWVVDISEFIWVYGELRQDEIYEWDELRLLGEIEKMVFDVLIVEIKVFREEVVGLWQEMQFMRLLEYKLEIVEILVGILCWWWLWGKC